MDRPLAAKTDSKCESVGRLIARALSHAWRSENASVGLSPQELSSVVPLLQATGGAGLGWWRIRESELANSPDASQLRDAYRRGRLAALVHRDEIERIHSLLRAKGIDAVLVKGWAIARRYPEQGLRPYGDIDLCVRPDQLAKAEHALQGLERLEGHIVDLHSGFDRLDFCGLRSKSLRNNAALSYRIWDKLTERSQLINLGEQQVRVLSDEDHLRILCLHLLRSGAWRPLWLVDVAVALESRADHFDWNICLGSDRKVARWVACTISLAQELLGATAAKSDELRVKTQTDGPNEQTGKSCSSALNVDALPFAHRALPRWLAPAVLRQWGRSRNPHAIPPALSALRGASSTPGKLFAESYARWDQPVRATITLRGSFNNWPRWPYQLGELLWHSAEVPKQMRKMINEFTTPKAANDSAQASTLGKNVPQAIPYPERV